MGGGENMRIEGAVGARGRDDRDLADARDLCGDGGHEQAGDERRVAAASAGDVQARAVHGLDLLSEDRAVVAGDEPRTVFLGFMEGADVGCGLSDAVEAFGGKLSGGPLRRFGGHAQGRPHVRAVETADIVEHGLVAVLAHGVQHGADVRFHVLFGIVAVRQQLQQFGPHRFGRQRQQTASHDDSLRGLPGGSRSGAFPGEALLRTGEFRAGTPESRVLKPAFPSAAREPARCGEGGFFLFGVERFPLHSFRCPERRSLRKGGNRVSPCS